MGKKQNALLQKVITTFGKVSGALSICYCRFYERKMLENILIILRTACFTFCNTTANKMGGFLSLTNYILTLAKISSCDAHCQ